MPHFNDDYFRDLPPRERRYDTPVADQLVFSVFPNGVKAWVHVYPCDDFVRRRTMGLFPEMGYQAALATLEQSRRIAELDAMQTRSPRRARVPYGKYAGVGLAAAALAAALTLVLTRNDPPQETPTATGSVPQTAAQIREQPGSVEQVQAPAAREADAPAEAPAPVDDPAGEPSGRDTAAVETDAVHPREETAATAGTSAPAPAEDGDVLPLPPGTGAAGTRVTAAPTADDVPSDTGATAIAVTRAILTTDVRDHEPADELSGTFRRPQEDPFRIYFFTELTGRPGDSVTHRWQRDGVTVAERRFSIGDGARWRVFSSKYIPPAGAGEWQAMVIDGTGRVIETRTLEIVTGP